MRRLAAVLLLTCAVGTQAATPDAGSILQQAEPVPPPEPSPGTTGLVVEQPGNGELPPSTAFAVKSITITGNTLVATADLRALIADAEGKSFTLEQLNRFAERITNYYHQHGYPLARAYIPMQAITDGEVRFAVLEAHYGTISLDNQSRVAERLLRATLAPLQGGQPIRQAEMDKTLLLLSDIPGVAINAILKPGADVGAADLDVEARPVATYNGNVSLDNFGSRSTGHERLGATLNYLDPFGHGDVLSVSLLSSSAAMKYARLSYETLMNGSGTRVGAAHASVNYTLGDTLAGLDGHGTAKVDSLWVKHPAVRSPNFNVYLQLQYDYKALDDHIDVAAINNQRRLGNAIFSISGDVRDNWLSGGASIWNLGYTSGDVAFSDEAARQADALAAETAGGFAKLVGRFTRVQALRAGDSVYIDMLAQWAGSNLDSAEKMVAGGAYSVRAYDVGALSGDSGYAETVELRHDFRNSIPGQWQAVAFVDSAQITVNHRQWTTANNSATLTGIGIGLGWTGHHQLGIKGYLAQPVGATPDLLTDTPSARVWLIVSRPF